GDRGGDRAPGARGADQADRLQRGPRGRRGGREGSGAARGPGPQRGQRRVRRHDQVRSRRPGQGHAFGAAERGVDRGAVPDDRGRGGGEAGEGEGPGGRRYARRRHGLLTSTRTSGCEGPPAKPGGPRVAWPIGGVRASPPMTTGRAQVGSHVAAVVRNRGLRRVLFAFGVFRPFESAQWIAILVYAYGRRGPDGMAVAAIVLLVPSAIAAPFLAHLGDVLDRERALALGYLGQGVTYGAVAIAIGSHVPDGVVLAFAAAANVAITSTRPV